jgi:SAM-dependent methyltransferase
MEPKEFHWPFSLVYSSLTRFMGSGYRDLASRMTIPDTARSALDLGGGDGRLAIALAETYPQLKQIVTADISEDMTRRARRRITQAGLTSTISAECRDMHALPYEEGRFDAVVSFGVLHHARDPEVFLGEAFRVLGSPGRLCLIDGYGRPSFKTIRQAVGRFGGPFVAAVIYWCGSKDCLPRDEIACVVSTVSLPGIDVVFDDVLVTIGGVKNNAQGQLGGAY